MKGILVTIIFSLIFTSHISNASEGPGQSSFPRSGKVRRYIRILSDDSSKLEDWMTALTKYKEVIKCFYKDQGKVKRNLESFSDQSEGKTYYEYSFYLQSKDGEDTELGSFSRQVEDLDLGRFEYRSSDICMYISPDGDLYKKSAMTGHKFRQAFGKNPEQYIRWDIDRDQLISHEDWFIIGDDLPVATNTLYEVDGRWIDKKNDFVSFAQSGFYLNFYDVYRINLRPVDLSLNSNNNVISLTIGRKSKLKGEISGGYAAKLDQFDSDKLYRVNQGNWQLVDDLSNLNENCRIVTKDAGEREESLNDLRVSFPLNQVNKERFDDAESLGQWFRYHSQVDTLLIDKDKDYAMGLLSNPNIINDLSKIKYIDVDVAPSALICSISDLDNLSIMDQISEIILHNYDGSNKMINRSLDYLKKKHPKLTIINNLD